MMPLQKPKTLDEAWEIILVLVKQNNELEALIKKLTVRINELEGQLHKNSRNSSKPPSSDGLAKPPRTQSLREDTVRDPGGQPGHPGKYLAMIKNPHKIVRHSVDCCHGCHQSLKGVSGTIERRQVFEIPPLEIEITEHQAEVVVCPHCGKVNRANFPAEAAGITNYGTNLQALAIYFMYQQLIPYARCKEIFSDLFSLPLSTGTLWHINQRVEKILSKPYQEISEQISQAKVAHFDETGMRVNGKLHWLHSASTENLTAYGLFPSRGRLGMDAFGILPKFKGRAVHDHLASYFDYTRCDHALCNAHHLRELIFIAEQEKEPWADEMKALLKNIHQAVEESKMAGKKRLAPATKHQYEKNYDRIVRQGLRYHRGLAPIKSTGQRGRKKQRPGKNLLDRLKGRRTEVLMFMHDFSIPFTNNLAERDIRMNKVKEKISGCFRSLNGAQIFCRIRTYLSTNKKQGNNILSILRLAVQGLPRLPNSV